MSYIIERKIAIEAVRQACLVCQAVSKRMVQQKEKSNMTEIKKDHSPVTVADYSAQAIVNHVIGNAFPEDPIVGEEDAGHLRSEEGTHLKKLVVELTNSVLENPLSDDKILAAIDRGGHVGGGKGRFWTLDPIDGTKGFLRNEQYAVALGLIVGGEVVLGVLGCPNLPLKHNNQHNECGAIFVAVKGGGSYERSIDLENETKIRVSDVASTHLANFCESAESGHSNHGDSYEVGRLLQITVPPIRMDSQCKYAAIARGDASIYLRLPTIKGYEEKIWDHAAGYLIVKEAGGKVSDVKGKELDFAIGRTLKANTGVIATNGLIHQQVVDAVMQVLSQKPEN